MINTQITQPSIKVLPLGPFIVDDKHAVNVYYLAKGVSHILIDLAPIQVIDQLKVAIKKHLEISHVTHIILMNTMMSTVHVLDNLIQEGFKGKIITNRFIGRQVINTKLDLEIDLIEDLNYQWGQNLQFIPMHFLPYPDMFMTYEPVGQVLFSSLLMSSYYLGDEKYSFVDLEKAIFAFHKDMIPSSDYIKPVLKVLEKYKINFLMPSYGQRIGKERFDDMVTSVKKMDFFNNYASTTKSDFQNNQLNYMEIINQLIGALNTHFSRIEILNAFIGSAFNLDPDTLTLKKTSLINYKMWHQFFEHVYAKKGMSWLMIMEPIMHKLIERYQLELPSIYRTETMKLKEETRILEEKRQQMEAELTQLNQQIEDAKDQILRDPMTKLYVQDQLRHIIKNQFENPISSGKTRGLLLIQLDQLQDINRRYSKETGDEAVKTLAYVLGQVKSEHVTLFKQSGPGILALIEEDTKEKIIEEAIKMRNAVASATEFIENMTASISIVTCEEVDPMLVMDEKIRFLFQSLENRIVFAKKKGKGEIVDESIELPQTVEGSILLVDQDEINRNMLFRIFKRINYDVILADSAHEAFSMLEKHKIDLVISEINLSKMDGFQLKMMMNESKLYNRIPFIMVSHNKTVDNIRRGNVLDVDLMLEKPIIPEELIGHVKRFKDRSKT